MVSATISANPLRLDVRSHIKCLLICFVATISTFQYGEQAEGLSNIWILTGLVKDLIMRLLEASSRESLFEPLREQD